MSQDIVLCILIKKAFALLLENENLGENCESLINTLNRYVEQLPRNCGMQTSLDNLKDGTVSLLDCYRNLKDTAEARFAGNSNDQSELRKENGCNSEISKPESETGNTSPFRDKAKQPNDSNDKERVSFSPNHVRLQEELQIIKESDEFKTAVNYFKKANESLAQIFEDNDERETKIRATEVRVISEILGNLTNLTDAAENCKQYILQLHESFNVHRDTEYINSVMYINVVLYDFIKTFIRKPVVILDWPMVDAQGPEKYHPILEKLQDPFTQITDTNKEKIQIKSCISAINCSGDIFARLAKEKASTDIVRITPNCNKWYSLNDDSGRKIVSIAIDCTDCKTSTESQHGETSTQSSPTPRLTSLICRGKMYILVRGEFQGNVRYFLYVVDMEGKKEHEEELGFLERISSTEVPKVKIFCINDQKLIILDVTRRLIHICDNKGMEKNTIDATAYLSNIKASRPPIFTYNGEMICLESKMNFLSKINVYNIVIDEKGSSLEKTREIKVKRAVQAVAFQPFDHKSDEIIILCYTLSLQYHLATYTKDGELIQDIKLHNGKYWLAGLICNPNGPTIALLDDFKLLHLK